MTRRTLFQALLAALVGPWLARFVPKETEVPVHWNPEPVDIASITCLTEGGDLRTFNAYIVRQIGPYEWEVEFL